MPSLPSCIIPDCRIIPSEIARYFPGDVALPQRASIAVSRDSGPGSRLTVDYFCCCGANGCRIVHYFSCGNASGCHIVRPCRLRRPEQCCWSEASFDKGRG